MKLKYLDKRIFFFLFLFFCSAQGFSWIKKEGEEYFDKVPIRYSTTREIKEYFYKLSDLGSQALYCRIRNNTINWKSTPRKDDWRNPHIIQYFYDLSKKFRLPDTDFILLTDDGCNHGMELPVFSFSASIHAENVCLLPDFEMFWELKDSRKNFKKTGKEYSRQYPWNKKISQGFFRGVATGRYNEGNVKDFDNSRFRLVKFSVDFPDLVDAGLSVIYYPAMANAYAALGKSLSSNPILDHFQYKYLLDVDGNANTYSRCRWILLSNSVLVKVMSSNAQWYYKAMKPWEHYVPVKEDLSDLADILIFLKENDELARQIAEAGQRLGEQIFSRDAVDSYVYALLQSYAKTVSLQ